MALFFFFIVSTLPRAKGSVQSPGEPAVPPVESELVSPPGEPLVSLGDAACYVTRLPPNLRGNKWRNPNWKWLFGNGFPGQRCGEAGATVRVTLLRSVGIRSRREPRNPARCCGADSPPCSNGELRVSHWTTLFFLRSGD